LLIDWFTVIAQVVNFLVLALLLKRFLYKPIIKAMNERAAQIAALLSDAQQQKQRAEEEAVSFHEKTQEISQNRQALLAQAEHEAAVRRQELLTRVHQEVDDTRNRWYSAIQQEKTTFFLDLQQRVARQVFQIARRGLQELGNVELEQHLIDTFIQRVKQVSGEERGEITENVLKAGKEVTIASAFDLPDKARVRITEALNQAITEGLQVKFETIPELIAGIELKAYGHKVAWSLENYLESLEENLSEVFAPSAVEPPPAGV
jgi:F-type H+-transporting ATPase subunit b